MDLHGIVRGNITAINPEIEATLYQSAGSGTNPDGTRVPYYTSTTAMVQVQALSAKDLEHVNSLNITGITRKVYLAGNQWASVVRGALKGGDLFEFLGSQWLINVVSEQWPDWTSVIVTQQLEGVTPTPTPTPSGFSIPAGLQIFGFMTPDIQLGQLPFEVRGLTGNTLVDITLLNSNEFNFGDVSLAAMPLIVSGDGTYLLELTCTVGEFMPMDRTAIFSVRITIDDVLQTFPTAENYCTFTILGV